LRPAVSELWSWIETSGNVYSVGAYMVLPVPSLLICIPPAFGLDHLI
jgi:hypothetical protein